jgi:hypothetical protein
MMGAASFSGANMKTPFVKPLGACLIAVAVCGLVGCGRSKSLANDADAQAMLKGKYKPSAGTMGDVGKVMAAQREKNQAQNAAEIKKIPADQLSEINAQRAKLGFPPLGADSAGGTSPAAGSSGGTPPPSGSGAK